MRLAHILCAAAAALTLSATANADQILGPSRIDNSKRVVMPGGPALGTFIDGKFTSQPDAIVTSGSVTAPIVRRDDKNVLFTPTLVPTFGVTGQGAPTTVSNYLFPEPADGRHFAVVGQINTKASGKGDKVGVFGGAESGSSTSDIWGGNFLAKWQPGSPDINVQGVEIDFDNYNHDVDASQDKLRTGLNVTSGGLYHGNVGTFIGSTTTANAWRNSLYVGATSFTNAGINIGSNPNYAGALVAAQPYGTTGDTVLMHRSTDTGAAGYFLRGVTYINSASLFSIDVFGNLAIGLNPIGGSPLSVVQQTDPASTPGTPFTGLSVENNASANSTAKAAQVSFYGRDTVAGRKQIGLIAAVPQEANWVGSDIALYARTGDALAEAFRVTGAGHPIGKGGKPTVSGCGAGASIAGTDSGGEVTIGSGATGCQITFATNWGSTPYCTVTSQAGQRFSYSKNGAAISLVNIDDLSVSKVDYRCGG